MYLHDLKSMCSVCSQPITPELYYPVDRFILDFIIPHGIKYYLALPKKGPSELQELTTSFPRR